jgi:hypothetical protein
VAAANVAAVALNELVRSFSGSTAVVLTILHNCDVLTKKYAY